MIHIKRLEDYCNSRYLDFEIKSETLFVDNKRFKIIDDQIKLFNSDFDWLPIIEDEFDGAVYDFGGRYYLHYVGEEVEMHELSNIGKAKQKLPFNSFIGIHSGNELLNGVGLYSDWIERAKFLGIKNLGICEKHTLVGVLDFQMKCKSEDIKPIIGMEIIVSKEDTKYNVKVYAKNFQGWQSLLAFNNELNVNEKKSIKEALLKEHQENLFIVIDPKGSEYKNTPSFIKLYQLDTVIYDNKDKDSDYINNLEKFLKSDLSPVELYDAYYINKGEESVRYALWGVAKEFDYKSSNQYLKNTDTYAIELLNLFEKGNASYVKLFKEARKNLKNIVDGCNFEYDTTTRHLPKYQMKPEEAKKFKTNEDLFLHLIKKGFAEKNIQDPHKYIDRLKHEIKVLKKGDVIDYFLILWDIIVYSKENNILTGVGRGSAGGSLISYLLGIIHIDPLEFDLIFSRFLNEGRIGEIKECEAFEIQTDKETIKLNEKSLLKIVRNQKNMTIFVEELKQGDLILKY